MSGDRGLFQLDATARRFSGLAFSLHFISSAFSLLRGEKTLAEGNESLIDPGAAVVNSDIVSREKDAQLWRLRAQMCGERSPVLQRNWTWTASGEQSAEAHCLLVFQ